MATQKFYLPDLQEADEERIEKSLRSLEGVLYAAANHADRCTEVEFEDDCVTPDEIRASLRELGFDSRTAG